VPDISKMYFMSFPPGVVLTVIAPAIGAFVL
jgi:hypothetical protein